MIVVAAVAAAAAVAAVAAVAVAVAAAAAAAVGFAGPSIGFGWSLDAVGCAVFLRVATWPGGSKTTPVQITNR